MKKSARDPGLELPVRFVPCSNGEHVPRPETDRDRRAVELFADRADANARRLGMSRRDFVRTACGMATALTTINVAYGCGSDPSAAPAYDVDGGDLDAARACKKIGGDEFIFDVQVHHVDATGKWREDPVVGRSVDGFPYATCGEPQKVDCFDVEHFVREVFVRSDTTVACLTGLPADPNPEKDTLSTEQRAKTRALVDRLAHSPRLLIHANVAPETGPAALDAMQSAAETFGVAAWKVYPSTWRFDDPAIAIPFVEKARALRVPIICAHRGIAGDDGGYTRLSSPREMVKVAQAYPDMKFLVYHSGYEGGSVVEGPHDDANPRGIDRLVKALREFPTTNVYAELGSTFRALMTEPMQLAHVLGKLLLHVGVDRVLWGTDCIWYGSPQEQIAALRAFQIPEAMQQQYGYPALTTEVKRKIFGLNGAAVYGVDPALTRCAIEDDDLSRAKQAANEQDWPVRDYGPRTRRELFRMLRGT